MLCIKSGGPSKQVVCSVEAEASNPPENYSQPLSGQQFYFPKGGCFSKKYYVRSPLHFSKHFDVPFCSQYVFFQCKHFFLKFLNIKTINSDPAKDLFLSHLILSRIQHHLATAHRLASASGCPGGQKPGI